MGGVACNQGPRILILIFILKLNPDSHQADHHLETNLDLQQSIYKQKKYPGGSELCFSSKFFSPAVISLQWQEGGTSFQKHDLNPACLKSTDLTRDTPLSQLNTWMPLKPH